MKKSLSMFLVTALVLLCACEGDSSGEVEKSSESKSSNKESRESILPALLIFDSVHYFAVCLAPPGFYRLRAGVANFRNLLIRETAHIMQEDGCLLICWQFKR